MKPTNRFLAALLISFPASFLPTIGNAQSTSFQYVNGKSCPGGFTQSRGMCTSTKGDKEGMVKNGRCPSGFTVTDAYCYREIKSNSPTTKSSSSQNRPDPSPEQTFAYKPITARVKKSNEADQCPTGYFTNRQDISECVTHYDDAPKTRLAIGGKCNSGETLERGKYCTGTSSMSPKDMDNAITYDSNELYTAYGIKHGKTPTLDSKPPELAATAVNALNSERESERAKREAENAEREQKAAAEQAAQDNHRAGQYRAMCEAARPNFPAGYPPGHTCYGIDTSGSTSKTQQSHIITNQAVQGSPSTANRDSTVQDAGKVLRGLLSR